MIFDSKVVNQLKFIEKQSLPILFLCLLIPSAVPHPIAGYMATALMLVFIGINFFAY
jgi:hypothetical protein